MRRVARSVLGLAVASAFAGPVLAQQTPSAGGAASAPPATTEAVAALAQPPAITDPLGLAIMARLNELGAASRAEDERTWLRQLVKAYAERAGKPLWVSDAGALTPAAGKASAELAKAAEWGLDPKAYAVPAALTDTSPAALAWAEIQMSLALVRYADHARNGRINPQDLSLWLDRSYTATDAGKLVTAVATAADPAAVLIENHPKHPGFVALRQAYLKTLAPVAAKPAEPAPWQMPEGPKLRPGMAHPDVAILRKRFEVAAGPEGETFYDEALARAVRDFMAKAGRSRTAIINESTREALNRPAQRAAAPQSDTTAARILANMERWRWLPDDLGELHVWNNLPETETRFVKNGAVIHQERIIIGKPDTQTPVFSDRIRFVVFQPDWGVPPSLKVKQLLPRLSSGDEDVLRRRDMKIMINGKAVDPGRFDWGRQDIRKVPIVQAPGPTNPLGQMKFMFPNKHDVYMHDTPDKGLFSSSQRLFSSGCIRVRNPVRFAELVMGEGKGWKATDIPPLLGKSSPENNRVDLERHIPVHNVYFTVTVGADGKIASLPDMYGHDRRVMQALAGRPLSAIQADDPARRLKEKIDDLVSGDDRPRGRQVAQQGVSTWSPWGGPSFLAGPQPAAKKQSGPSYAPSYSSGPKWSPRSFDGVNSR